ADVTDDLHRDHVIADLEPRFEFREMRVPGRYPTGVIHRDAVSTGPLVADRMNYAGTGGADRRAHRCAEVGSLVRHDLLQNGMHPLRVEARRDRRSLDRLSPTALVHCTPVRVVVAVGFLSAKVVDAKG